MASAVALTSGEIERTECRRIRGPAYSIEYEPKLLALEKSTRMMDVFALSNRLDFERTIVHTHDVVLYMGHAIVRAGWVIVTSLGEVALHRRLAQVDAIFEVPVEAADDSSIWCISLNVFPDTSLVRLDSGQLASTDPQILLESGSRSDEQITFRLERETLARLLPVMKAYGSASVMSHPPFLQLVYFLPE